MTDQPHTNPQTEGTSNQEAPEGPPFTLTLPDEAQSQRDWYLWAGVMALLILVAFWPTILGNFIWDDENHVTQNPSLLDWHGLVHIWIPPIFADKYNPLETIQYYPLVHTTFWIEHHIWGDTGSASVGYHVVNLLLHAAGAVVLWRVLRRLKLPGAWAAAAIWAVHPLQAESVCWISERKNVLCGVLTFASLFFYLDYAGLKDPASDPGKKPLFTPGQSYALSLLLFILALFAKTVAVSLLPVIALLLWWKRKLDIPKFLGLIPMAIVGLILSGITASRETDPNGPVAAGGPGWHLSFIQHILLPARDFWFYLGKIFVPINLSFNYARIAPTAGQISGWLFLVALIVLLAVLYLGRNLFGRGPIAAVLCYIAALLPAMGFVPVFPYQYSYVADHFQYFAGVCIIALVVAGAAKILAALVPASPHHSPEAPSPGMYIPAAFAAVIAIALAGTSWVRAGVFVDNGSLWQDTLTKNPNSWLAAYLLGRTDSGFADKWFAEANDAHRAGDTASEQAAVDGAHQSLDEAQANFHKALGNPQAPQDVLYQSYDELAVLDIKRRELPDADLAALSVQAREDVEKAIAGEAPLDHRMPDAAPILNLGNITMLEADALKKDFLAASTRASTQTSMTVAEATTQPTSRPATPEEQAVLKKYFDARECFVDAVNTADRGLIIPNVARASLQTLGRATGALGLCDFSIAQLANMRHDTDTEQVYLGDAAKFLSQSSYIDNSNLDIQQKLALCLEGLQQWNQAVAVLKRALVVKPNPSMFDEIGMIYLEHLQFEDTKPGAQTTTGPSATTRMKTPEEIANTAMNDTVVAVECFKTAIAMAPNYEDAKRHLALAESVLQQIKAATRASTTEPRSQP